MSRRTVLGRLPQRKKGKLMSRRTMKFKRKRCRGLFGALQCPPELQQLRKRCLAPIQDFRSEGEVGHTPDGCYVYRDNGASILAVAHLDVVQPAPRHFGARKGRADVIYNAQLDDRLGAWIILDLLPAMGVNVDVLLTEGEESCRSTAAHFWPDKQYNWLIEFDRGGTDVVMYDYETFELIELLEAQENETGWGTYSDISEMGHLGVAGFNWGIGYYDNHFRNSHFKVSECREAISRFVKFYEAHKDTSFPYVPRERDMEDYNSGWLREEDREWIREMEAQQNLGEEEGEDEEYRRLWQEAEERRQWEEDRWGRSREFNWNDRFTANHYTQ